MLRVSELRSRLRATLGSPFFKSYRREGHTKVFPVLTSEYDGSGRQLIGGWMK